MVVQTSDRRWKLLWAFVFALWLAAGIARLKAEETSVPLPGSQEFIRWCRDDATNTEWLLWMCFLYV